VQAFPPSLAQRQASFGEARRSAGGAEAAGLPAAATLWSVFLEQA
jgi:hypothetical protein